MLNFSLAFSSCPNDTFIMYAIVHEKINLHNLKFQHHITDIEKLNMGVINSSYDISKSSSTMTSLSSNYTLLKNGSAMSENGGPLLIGKNKIDEIELPTIALPGKHTTATKLFERFHKKPCKKIYVPFSDIFGLIAANKVDAGVVIHEDRFTYWHHGFELIYDLGLEWNKETQLPVPLGVFLIKNEIAKYKELVESIIHDSIIYAQNNFNEVFPWVQGFAKNENPQVIKQHIDYYVNKYTLNISKNGEKAIRLINSK